MQKYCDYKYVDTIYTLPTSHRKPTESESANVLFDRQGLIKCLVKFLKF